MTLIKNLNWIVTLQCNSACIHCDIWRTGKAKAISLADAKKVLSLPLIKKSYRAYGKDFGIALGGGEPFMLPHLDLLAAHIQKELPGALKTISTNGLQTKKVLDFLKRFSFLGSKLNISIDGIKAVHDRMRGVNGAFNRTLETVRSVRKYFPGTEVQLKLTLVPQNHDQILDVYRLSKGLGCDFVFKPAENMRYYTNSACAPELNFSRKQLQGIRKQSFFLAEEMYHRQDLSKAAFFQDIPFYLEGKKKPLGCSFFNDSLSLMPDGSCFTCFKMPSVGNILKDNLGHQEKKLPAAPKQCDSCMLMCGAFKDYELKTSAPVTANVEVTSACNLDCDMCTQKSLRSSPRHMKLKAFSAILHRSPEACHVSFLGGEPFLNPDLWKMMHLCDKNGVTYEITTNGTLLHRGSFKRLQTCTGLKKINFSLDGMKKRHDSIRGKGSFLKCLSAIKACKNFTSISVSSVLRKDNHREIQQLVSFLKKIGVRHHKIILGMSIGPAARKMSIDLVSGLIIQGPSFDQALRGGPLAPGLFKKLKAINKDVSFEPAWPDIPWLSGNGINQGGFSCRQLNGYRFNVKGKRIICEFIRNRYTERMVSRLNRSLLPICSSCCKLEKRQWQKTTPLL